MFDLPCKRRIPTPSSGYGTSSSPVNRKHRGRILRTGTLVASFGLGPIIHYSSIVKELIKFFRETAVNSLQVLSCFSELLKSSLMQSLRWWNIRLRMFRSGIATYWIEAVETLLNGSDAYNKLASPSFAKLFLINSQPGFLSVFARLLFIFHAWSQSKCTRWIGGLLSPTRYQRFAVSDIPTFYVFDN